MVREQHEPTTDAESEQRLARSLGYPKSWHVVRSVMPDPTNAAAAALVQDRIFAGDPAKNADLYYNHGAAYAAALGWAEGESTPYDDGGGQMLPRHARYSRGEEVEVLYDDGKWYGAIIKKVTHHQNDVRYSVLYTEEDTYQNNVTEDEMRQPILKRGKAKGGTAKKKRAAGGSGGAPSHHADPAELELASAMGLPDGWMAKANKNSRYVFRSPDGKHKFQSKKAVFEFLGISAPPPAKKAKTAPKVQQEEEEDAADVEEGDPPWRLDGHEYLGKRVRYQNDDGVEQTGKVAGWISETDVDKAGDPGFVSESTGKPAALFHVVFEFDETSGDIGSMLDSQDFEEYELLDCFVAAAKKQKEEKFEEVKKEEQERGGSKKDLEKQGTDTPEGMKQELETEGGEEQEAKEQEVETEGGEEDEAKEQEAETKERGEQEAKEHAETLAKDEALSTTMNET